MITLSGKRYAKDQAEMSKLSNAGAPYAGFYQTRKNGVLFLDLQKMPFAFAARDVTTGGCFFVNASRIADGKEKGRTWFNFATNELTEKQLGIESLSYSQQKDAAKAVIVQAGIF